MSIQKLEPMAGDTFSEVSYKAKEMAVDSGNEVEFDFNGISVLVNKTTNLDHLSRDYSTAWKMEWKSIGPHPTPEYSPALKAEIKTREDEIEAARQKRQQQQAAEDEKQKATVDELVKGVSFLIWPGKEDEYKQYVETNSTDGYSKAVVEYGEYWAKLMQLNGGRIQDIAEETQKPLGFLGITGFQYGCVVKALSYFWQDGEALRKWHNKKYGHEGKGVVNPAILTIRTD